VIEEDARSEEEPVAQPVANRERGGDVEAATELDKGPEKDGLSAVNDGVPDTETLNCDKSEVESGETL
jgi:hypothetical protein